MQALYPELDPVPGEKAPRPLRDDDNEDDNHDAEGDHGMGEATEMNEQDMMDECPQETLPEASTNQEAIPEASTNQEAIPEALTNHETIPEAPTNHETTPEPSTIQESIPKILPSPDKATAAKSKACKVREQVWEDDDDDDCIMADTHDAVAMRRAQLEAELEKVRLMC